VFGLYTTAVYQEEIVPLSSTGRVTTLLRLPDQPLVLDARWETIS
jgi:hypothetical protein